MRSWLIVAIIVSSVILIPVVPAYSELSSGKKYVVQAVGYLVGDQTLADSSMTLQVSSGAWVGNDLFATLDSGIITIGDDSYLNAGAWQITMLRGGKYLSMTGDAQDLNGNTIHLNLFGRTIYSNQDNVIYSFTGKADGIDATNVFLGAKMSSVSLNVTSQHIEIQPSHPQEQPQPNPENQTFASANKTQISKTNLPVPKIMLVARQSSPVPIQYTYSISIKVFDAGQNPSANFDQFYGVIPNANLTGQILDSNKKVVQSFGGLTDKGGYYSYSFRIPFNFVPGTYTVNLKAQIGPSIDNKTLTLFIRQYNN